MFEIFNSDLKHMGSSGHFVHYWYYDNAEYKVNESWLIIPMNGWNCD